MSYCEGDLVAGNRRFSNCSKAALPFAFDPSVVLSKETGNTTSLSNLGWPDSVTDDFHAFSMTSRSIGILYCIGAGAAGLAIVGRLYWLVRRGPRQSVMEVAALLVKIPPPTSDWDDPSTNHVLVGVHHARNFLDYCDGYRVSICRSGQ